MGSDEIEWTNCFLFAFGIFGYEFECVEVFFVKVWKEEPFPDANTCVPRICNAKRHATEPIPCTYPRSGRNATNACRMSRTEVYNGPEVCVSGGPNSLVAPNVRSRSRSMISTDDSFPMSVSFPKEFGLPICGSGVSVE